MEKANFLVNIGLSEKLVLDKFDATIKSLIVGFKVEVAEVNSLGADIQKTTITAAFKLLAGNEELTKKINNYKQYPSSVCFNFWVGCMAGCSVAHPMFSDAWNNCISICDAGYALCWILGDE